MAVLPCSSAAEAGGWPQATDVRMTPIGHGTTSPNRLDEGSFNARFGILPIMTLGICDKEEERGWIKTDEEKWKD